MFWYIYMDYKMGVNWDNSDNRKLICKSGQFSTIRNKYSDTKNYFLLSGIILWYRKNIFDIRNFCRFSDIRELFSDIGNSFCDNRNQNRFYIIESVQQFAINALGIYKGYQTYTINSREIQHWSPVWRSIYMYIYRIQICPFPLFDHNFQSLC